MPVTLNSFDLKDFLDTKVERYNNPKFIESDPIQIPHQFSKKEDIEIACFLTQFFVVLSLFYSSSNFN